MADIHKPNQNDSDFLYHYLYLPRGVERLEKLGVHVEFPKNAVLNKIGEIPDCCYVVKTGRVLCYELSYNGDQRVYNIMEPGSIFLEECMLFDKPCPIEFRTLEKCCLIKIDKCDLKRAFKSDIDVVMDICESLSTKFLSSMEHLRLGPRQSAGWKVCKMLLITAQHYGEMQPDGTIVITQNMSQQMLADILGINRVTVTRKLKKFKESGLFEITNGKMVFRDLNVLEEYMATMESE